VLFNLVTDYNLIKCKTVKCLPACGHWAISVPEHAYTLLRFKTGLSPRAIISNASFWTTHTKDQIRELHHEQYTHYTETFPFQASRKCIQRKARLYCQSTVRTKRISAEEDVSKVLRNNGNI